MEVIHPNTSLTPVPELELFGIPPTQNSIIKNIATEHRPLAAIDNASTLDFQINTALDEYIRLDETELYLRIKFALTDSAWATVYPVKYLLHSMIRQVDMYIGDRLVTTSPQTYMYKAYFEAFLGFTKDAKKSHMTSALWYEDDDLPQIKTYMHNEKQGNEIELMGRLHLDLAHQDRFVLGGATIRVSIHLNSPKFFMMGATDQKPTVDLVDAAIFAHRAKIHPDVVYAHNKALELAPARYPICHAVVKAFTISKGDYSVFLDNVHNGHLPRRILLAMVPNDAFIGSYVKNPYEFKSMGLMYLAAHYNGTQYPSRAYQPNFDKKFYIREMRDLFRSLQQANADTTIPISRENYGNGNAIFGFNFAPDLNGGCLAAHHASPVESGVLGIELRFKESLAEPITVLVYCDFDKVVEIDSTRNATINF